MKAIILKILNKHKFEAVETWLTDDVISAEQFEEIAEEIESFLIRGGKNEYMGQY